MLKTSDPDKAARAYLEYLHEMDIQNVSDRDEQGKAHMFLANHYFTKKDYDSSHKHAFKCLEFPEVKDEAKALLVQLAAVTAKPGGSTAAEPEQSSEVTDMDISQMDEKTQENENVPS